MTNLKNIRSQLTVILLTISLVSLLLVSVVSYRVTSQSLKEKLRNSSELSLKQILESIDLAFAEYESVVNLLCELPQIRDVYNHESSVTAARAALNFPLKYSSTIMQATVAYENGTYIRSSEARALPQNYDVRTRPWYQEVKAKNGAMRYANPYMGRTLKKLLTTVNRSFSIDGKMAGMVSLDINLEVLSQKLTDLVLKKYVYLQIISPTGLNLAIPDKKLLGQEVNRDKKWVQVVFDTDSAFQEPSRDTEGRFIVHATDKKHNWKIILHIDKKELSKETAKLAWRISFITLLIVVFVMLVAFYIAKRITFPINQVIKNLVDVSQGILKNEIDTRYLQTQSELGELARSMQVMTNKLIEIVKSVQESSSRISLSSEELNKASESMSQGSSEQAATIEEISSSMLEITDSIKNNAKNSQETSRIALTSSTMADASQTAVIETVNSMDKIAEKVSIIQDIAGQTRLLALNASIEAARAGQTGKGFAVVASEVSKLAELSSSSAAEIDELAKSSVAVAKSAGEKLNVLVPEIKRTADLVSNITENSSQQENSVAQVNTAIQQVNNVVQQNAAHAEELAATAAESNSQASNLQKLIAYFRL